MTTDTPRTETYVLNPHPESVPAEFARELERELAASKAEVERLDQMVEWFIENAPHFTLAQFNEHQRTLNSTDE
jgi:hypothetical protein